MKTEASGNALNLLYYIDQSGMVVASDGTVYVADWDNNRVIKFTEGTAEGEVILNQIGYRGALYLDDNDASVHGYMVCIVEFCLQKRTRKNY